MVLCALPAQPMGAALPAQPVARSHYGAANGCGKGRRQRVRHRAQSPGVALDVANMHGEWAQVNTRRMHRSGGLEYVRCLEFSEYLSHTNLRCD